MVFGFSIFKDLYLATQASPEKRVVPIDSACRDESNGIALIWKPFHRYTILLP
uniref:Uncharacterized protein n=1 Tax=Meloidogyne enterolobii TaxID=390850 RepID=A0A6V7UT71_MELEN|nr:unnamed protein product [Meloidogyne enterolobii]